MKSKKIVVVLGMHRSGTSAITRGLQVLGVELGGRLLPAELGVNDKGFWEDADITAFNVDLLSALGHDWHTLKPVLRDELFSPTAQAFRLRAVQLLREKIANTEVFGIKDPRMARVLPFWKDVFSHVGIGVGYVIAFRNPMNVTHSLKKRNDFDRAKSYHLWLEHMLSSINYSNGSTRIFVNYDLLLDQPGLQLRRIADTLGLNFSENSLAFQEYKQHFLDASLQHNRFALSDLVLDSDAPPSVIALSEVLEKLSSDRLDDDAGLEKEILPLWGTVENQVPLYRLASNFDYKALCLSSEIDQIKSELSYVKSELLNRDVDLELKNEKIYELLNVIEERSVALADLEKEDARLRGLIVDARNQIESLNILAVDQSVKVFRLQERICLNSSLRFLIREVARKIRFKLIKPFVYLSIRRRGLFDQQYYLERYDDIRVAGVDPFAHYMSYGWREGRDPSHLFSTNRYLDSHHDVWSSGVNPLLHYVRYGEKEGRAVWNVHGKIVSPSRDVSTWQRIVDVTKALQREPRLFFRFFQEVRRAGVRRSLELVAVKLKLNKVKSFPVEESQAMDNSSGSLGFGKAAIPFYLNPYLENIPAFKIKKIALHFYLSDVTSLDKCIKLLGNVPQEFDLFLSVSDGVDASWVHRQCFDQIRNAKELVVESVPSFGNDVAPLIVRFGGLQGRYDYIGHFYLNGGFLESSFSGGDGFEQLCASPSVVAQIFRLLEGDGECVFVYDRKGVALSSDKQERDTFSDGLSQQSFALPQGSMFWCKTHNIKDFINSSLHFDDFPSNEFLSKVDLVEYSKYITPVRFVSNGGRYYCIESSVSVESTVPYYEAQQDYSPHIFHDTIKVLAYYLPQFHPTPENDEWHGRGFTEWHKVRSAYPLFEGHYQQHVPHSDIGYYHLNSPDQFEVQAQMMRKAGIHGMIFYHYWFSGRLILEKPAQMLLANPQIDMPFCFCWANENWTRRWDGNEREILLGQIYSQEDAVEFIRYLIPFFKDDRYIRIEGRPVLFVYRPSSIECCEEYINSWREECVREGLLPPYIVATLTRGATSPEDYGMDAAVERVLHDWTDGQVPDVRASLRAYWPLNGSVLNYSAVADHYMDKQLQGDYTLFRSLVPTWDNTARYGSGAFLLHGFTTEKMQAWMENLIDFSEKDLPEDRRFIVVNAWNEWAEGAHLEPDTRFGYGYLNSIGRALCGFSFKDIRSISIPDNLRLCIHLEPCVQDRLFNEPETARKFFSCLSESLIFSQCHVFLNEQKCSALINDFNFEICADSADADFSLVFSDVFLFSSDCIDTLVRMALRHRGFAISACIRNDPDYLNEETPINFEIPAGKRSGMEVRPSTNVLGFKICSDASCFRCDVDSGRDFSPVVRPLVSAIVRFHRQANRQWLMHALMSLVAQGGCRVQAHIAIQDMNDAEVELLKIDVMRLPWLKGDEPVIYRHFSTLDTPDLRSKMLNETLKSIGSGYAAFIDYDDVLFPFAYRILLEQIRRSKKNATFGRVYVADLDSDSGLIVRRNNTYEYGYSYDEFVAHNHAPLHSFLLDLNKINLDRVHYFDDMKYMEDYYLTLQVFSREDTDWASLHCCSFIGDYVHRMGGEGHTLAVNGHEERNALLSNHNYMRCESRINELRAKIKLVKGL